MLGFLTKIGNVFSGLKRKTVHRNHMFVVGTMYHYSIWRPTEGPSRGYSFAVETKTYLLANTKKEHSHSTLPPLMIPLERFQDQPNFNVSKEDYKLDIKLWDDNAYDIDDITFLETTYKRSDRKELV